MEPTLGEYIRKRREDAGLSRATLADLAGFKRETSISNIELGLQDVPRDHLPKLLTALGVAEDEWPEVLRLPRRVAPEGNDAPGVTEAA